MSKEIKAALITGLLGIVASIIAAFIANNVGKNQEQQITLDTINSQISIINGDNNAVTINSIDDFIKDYQNLQAENKSLRLQNTQYFDELTKARNDSEANSNALDDKIEQLNNEINQLNKEINLFPSIQFRNLSLSIDGNAIPINTSNSSVIVNNRTYYADDFINNILDSNTNVSILDGTMYIGKIIKEKTNLIGQWVVNNSSVSEGRNWVDSYGNTHTNSLCFLDDGYIIYNLNEEYSLLKFNLSISENANLKRTGILVVKADGEIVYTSPELTKTTKPFDVIDVPINNCTLLTIEYSTEMYNRCIMSDIEIYN